MPRTTALFYGLWTGLLVAGSAVFELFIEEQVVLPRTIIVVAILSVAGVFSGAASGWFLYKPTRAVFMNFLVLCLANVALFFVFGAIISYLVLILPEQFDPYHNYTLGLHNLWQFIGGFLGSSFSFRSFGLPLTWPFGAVAGAIVTYIFVSYQQTRYS